MIIFLTIITTLLIAAIFGGLIYLLFGSLAAVLIAAVATVIAVCVTFGIIRIVSILKNKKS